MLQDAVARIAPVGHGEDVFVSTGVAMADLVRKQLPDLSAEHLLIEPALRNTGPAVGLECALLEARFPGCVVASLGSDHYIGKNEEFRRLLQAAEAAIESYPDYLFMLGVTPTRAETGYGYIRRGSLLETVSQVDIHTVNSFTEKPDITRAREYVKSGQYLWNSNMFVWKAATVLDLFARYEPEMYQILEHIGRSVGTGREREVIAEAYPELKAVAIDNAIIERAEKVATIEADIEWGDIGTWAALTDVLPTDEEGNLFSAQVVALDSRDATVYAPSDKVVALIGMEDVVVVDTEDALLICKKDEAQRVRDVLEVLENSGVDRYS